jgi:hypothetical protein
MVLLELFIHIKLGTALWPWGIEIWEPKPPGILRAYPDHLIANFGKSELRLIQRTFGMF